MFCPKCNRSVLDGYVYCKKEDYPVRQPDPQQVDPWFRSPEFLEAYDKFTDRKEMEAGEIFEHSKEFRNARSAYRRRIQGS